MRTYIQFVTVRTYIQFISGEHIVSLLQWVQTNCCHTLAISFVIWKHWNRNYAHFLEFKTRIFPKFRVCKVALPITIQFVQFLVPISIQFVRLLCPSLFSLCSFLCPYIFSLSLQPFAFAQNYLVCAVSCARQYLICAVICALHSSFCAVTCAISVSLSLPSAILLFVYILMSCFFFYSSCVKFKINYLTLYQGSFILYYLNATVLLKLQ